ncbi:MAG TPA: cell division protein FtsA [Bryobacteraceae bacterium]|nr:cell division protein FtsA [Bryobacteraceae bacterium]
MSNKPQYAVGLDAGSSSTRCVIGSVEDGRLRYLGHGEAPSLGWSKGRIADPQALSESIAESVHEAEMASGASIEGMVAGVGGAGVSGFHNRGVYEFGRPRPIEQEDLTYAVERAARVRLEDGRCLLQLFPQDFTLDGRAGYRNPRGSTCSRLEANAYVVTAPAQEHHTLVNAIHLSHYAVEETVYEALAAAYAAVLSDDRSRGVALIDIGFDSTDIVVYDGEALVLAKSLAVSSDHFTRDVAFGFKISYEDAEMLKRDYGCAMLGLTADNSLIEVPSPEGRAPREANRRQLNEILEARAEELFFFVRRELAAIGMEQSLLEGVVLTGGGALLNGMCDMAERVLNCQARNGLPIGIENWPDDLETPLWTAAAGLMMYSARLKFKRESKRKAPGLIGLVLK